MSFPSLSPRLWVTWLVIRGSVAAWWNRWNCLQHETKTRTNSNRAACALMPSAPWTEQINWILTEELRQAREQNWIPSNIFKYSIYVVFTLYFEHFRCISVSKIGLGSFMALESKLATGCIGSNSHVAPCLFQARVPRQYFSHRAKTAQARRSGRSASMPRKPAEFESFAKAESLWHLWPWFWYFWLVLVMCL